MKVLFVAWRDLAHPNAGGSEVVIDRLARGLQDRGHEVALLCGGPIAPRPYEVVEAGGTYSQYALAPLRYRRHFRDADVVVDVVNGMPFFSPLWRRGARLCLVHHVHGDQWGQYFPAPVAAVGRTVEQRVLPRLYRGTRFMSISPSTQAELEALGVPGERIHLMYNGLALDDIGDHPRSAEPLFVSLGRLAPNKRIDLLLDMWPTVRAATGGRLVIAGDGPERPAIEARAAVMDGVELTGRIDERRKAELLHEAWLLVHPALHEGWGLVTMEAAACGTPTVAFDVPGVRDAVLDGVTGLLAVDEADFVRQWVHAAGDAELRSALGDVGRRRALEFTWDGTIDDFTKAAEAALAEVDRRPVTPVAVAEPSSWVADPSVDAARRPVAPGSRPVAPPAAGGLRRSVELFRLFRREPVEPTPFYEFLAADTVAQLHDFVRLDGATALDIGGGPGYTAEALRAEGARCVVVEYSHGELLLHDRQPDGAVVGDGQALPVATGSVQLCHSSNVLEHVPRPEQMLAEMARVLEPASGIGYLTFTNWYSPWGGHETSPWHYLGGERAARRFEQRHGRPAKNRFGASLFPLHVRQVTAWFDDRDDLEVLWVGPRYLPRWARPVVHVPGLREVVTWNLVVVFRRLPTVGWEAPRR